MRYQVTEHTQFIDGLRIGAPFATEAEAITRRDVLIQRIVTRTNTARKLAFNNGLAFRALADVAEFQLIYRVTPCPPDTAP